MRALLLAAGKGTRISRYLDGRPKCCVDLGKGKTLIEYTIDTLRKMGVSDIAIVTGYNHEHLEKTVQKSDVTFYYSPFFDVTNSIASAWFAKEFLAFDDILIMNADVFCEESLLDEMISIKMSPVFFFDTTRIEGADYKFYCPDGKIEKYGKNLTAEETTGEYVGVAKLNKEFVPTFRNNLCKMINLQQHNAWWEDAIYTLSGEIDVLTYDVAPKFWGEVDYVEDYEKIRKFME